MTQISFFEKDDGRRLPVSDDFLVPYLSPTSPGTQYWDSPPPGPMTDRQRGRVSLQLHQLLHLLSIAGVDLKDSRFLDIGTGNGMIPRLMLEFSDLPEAVGIDPFLNGEHTSSWQVHDQDEEFQQVRDFIRSICPRGLDHDAYRHLTAHEHYALVPAPVSYGASPKKQYGFHQIGAHDLRELEGRFDILYAKAIDHIPDWEGIFSAAAAVASDRAVFVIKHFSFFSFLGPHRYATTNIPWGHLLLTDDEYRRFAKEFHGPRADKMTEFYFSGLSYPRTPLPELVKIATRNGFVPKLILNDVLKNAPAITPLIDQVEGFWEIKDDLWPQVSFEEMLSGRYHMLFARA